MIISQESSSIRIGLFSAGMRRIPGLAQLMGAELVAHSWRGFPKPVDAIAGWGAKPNTARARRYAARHGLPYLALEDGFVRSHGTGERFPPLALVVDDQGIYYNSTRPSALETLLASETDVLAAGIGEQASTARELLLTHRLSKYNQAQATFTPEDSGPRILVVDQTAGDMSVQLGGADASTFAAMVAAARAEHPQARLYIKTHPEVSSGRKRGYLSHLQDDAHTQLLREPCNPHALIAAMDQVYVVSSTLGFEALLARKPVTVFGQPWYAGWGVTDDRQPAFPRRTRQRSVLELFAAAYLHYSRYLNPATHERGTLFDVIDWLLLQRQGVARLPRRVIAVGMRRWKAAHLKPILAMAPEGVRFVRQVPALAKQDVQPGDGLVHWGRDAPAGLPEFAKRQSLPIQRLEDGFYRSVGLGSDLIRPRSLVLDRQGLYFDPRGPSDLETLLNTAQFTADDCQRAARIRQTIVNQGLTKYNLEPPGQLHWPADGRPIILAPGQVEDDASIRYGCEQVRTNLDLLESVRAAQPEAFIVYKPHPDVLSGNRRGRVLLEAARQYADWVEPHASPVACLNAADAVHTLTSLTGFEALLRAKPVRVYGRPFYAGWGLTEDQRPIPRRARRLMLDELVAGVMLHYAFYWDWTLHGFTSCEAVLAQLATERERWAASGQLSRLKDGWWSRQGRKLLVLIKTVRGGA
ncbi:capsular polysaccharide biosynthesis protein [Thiorhodovibrio frisius]|uniref:Capsule polysaccharide export protein n=1 Tax=Thiorhodovibrio frisius TaxID=631362 RepID=H8Z1V4_9GAMM|nr:capsular polysaccharide biosynthesis protein [Thiorhodovibrio frisius]EIC22582.1 capsule polysaccharide export protein [Thiorhodovibrio frisius]WPL20023.1 Capsule polysaccharide biosynthesis protein [Thiorhodovibrio frisius]